MVASFVGEAWQYKINLVVNIFPFEMENESSNMNKKEKKGIPDYRLKYCALDF